MHYWDQLINTALLGTDKRPMTTNDWPSDLAAVTNSIQENTTTDKEEQFLQIAALAFNYRQCGVQPLQKEGVTITKAGEEEKQYGSAKAMQALKDIFDIESPALLRLWLQQCTAKQRIVIPELAPVLLAAGATQKKLQPLLTVACGKRGEWLSQFNSEWRFSAAATDDELWQTGNLEQRKQVLQQQRQVNPAQALAWLQQTWTQEDAATKQELLSILTTNIGAGDIAFLESLATEKGKKVKDLALRLLKQIPDSPVVLQYQQVLQQAVQLKKEKTMLGLSSHTSLDFQLPSTIDEAIFKTGIDKLSSNSKAFSDEEYILYQLIQGVAPAFWETHLSIPATDIIQQWQKDAIGKKLLPALVNAISNFKSEPWAIAMMQTSEVFYIDLIPLLPAKEQEFYSIKFMYEFGGAIIEYAARFNNEWSIDLTKAIFTQASKEVYSYNKAFYNNHIHLIPVAIAPLLEKFTPTEEHLKGYWRNNSEYLTRLLQLKQQTIQSFNE